MRDEVEEFLKRVAQMRAQAEAQARAAQARPPQQQPQPGAPGPARQPPRPRLVPEETAYLEPVEAEVVDAELAETGDNVSRHVAEHLRGPQEIAARASQLGAEVDLADDKLAARLHQTFDHEIGKLRKSVTDVAAAAASDAKRTGFTAGSIAAMLLSPDNIRNAIILGEILRRPEEKW